jgi:hypothetical protein
MHPVGPSSPTTYWIRRVLAVVLAVAVLVGVILYLASRSSRSSAGADPSAAAVTSAAPTLTGVLANSTGPSRSTVPSPTPTPSPTPSGAPTDASASPTDSAAATPSPTDAAPTDSAAPDAAPTDAAPTDTAAAAPTETTPAAPAPPPPSYDADGKLLCADSSIAVAAQAPAQVAAGANVIVGITVTNSGTEACRRDVSGSLQVFTVFGADGTRMWSTADCFPGQGTEVRELAPGEALKYTVKWSGTTSAPGCAGERAPLAAGSYTLIAQLGALSSPPAAFTVG